METTVIRISKALDERLDALAAKTGRRKSFYASKALERYLEDQEDYLLAVAAYEESKGKRSYTLEEVEKLLGLEIGNYTSRGKRTRKARGGRSATGEKVSQK